MEGLFSSPTVAVLASTAAVSVALASIALWPERWLAAPRLVLTAMALLCLGAVTCALLPLPKDRRDRGEAAPAGEASIQRALRFPTRAAQRRPAWILVGWAVLSLTALAPLRHRPVPRH